MALRATALGPIVATLGMALMACGDDAPLSGADGPGRETPHDEAAPPPTAGAGPVRRLVFQPGHRMTDVGDTAPRVVILTHGVDRDFPALVTELGRGVHLERLDGDEARAVPARTTAELLERESVTLPAETAVTFADAKLEEGWYRLRIDALPDGVQLPAKDPVEHLPDGSVAARFHVGSRPTVRWVTACPDGRVGLDLSERVRPRPDLLPSIALHRAGRAVERCRIPEGQWEEPSAHLYLDCRPGAAEPVVAVELPDGFVAESGRPLRDGSGEGRRVALERTDLTDGPCAILVAR
jgi:hypothetical protein